MVSPDKAVGVMLTGACGDGAIRRRHSESLTLWVDASCAWLASKIRLGRDQLVWCNNTPLISSRVDESHESRV
jgi:hypothetical protein